MRTNMKIARTVAGIKQIQIACELNVSKQTVNKWEMGRAPVARKHWTRLAALFNLSERELEAALVQTLLDACIASNTSKPLLNAQVSRQYSSELIEEALARFVETTRYPSNPRPAEPQSILEREKKLEYEREIFERDKKIFELEKEVAELRRQLESDRPAFTSSALNIEPLKHEVSHE